MSEKAEVKEKKAPFKKEEKRQPNNAVAREIVRIAGLDLNGNMRVDIALRKIKGVGLRVSRVLTKSFFKQANIPTNTLLGNIPSEKDEILNNLVSKIILPEWMVNRQKDLETGDYIHLTGSDLIFMNREDRQRLSRIKSRRGMRLLVGLPVRGQRTKSNFRRKMGVVGVVKKASKPGKAAPKPAAPKPAAKKK